MLYTRRDISKIALAALPLSSVFGASSSQINGVQIGVITYSFHGITDLDEIINGMLAVGLNEVELMSNVAEAYAGASVALRLGGRRLPGSLITPQQEAEQRAKAEEMRKFRMSASMDKFKEIRKKFTGAGIDLRFFCFNMEESITDDEIEYGFQAAKALGVKAITSTTQLSTAKRVAPFADKHKFLIGYHNHAEPDPNGLVTPESFAMALSYSKYHRITLDLGHFTAGNFDAMNYVKQRHSDIIVLHMKDRKKNQGSNQPWGQGDTPIKEVLQLVKRERYAIPLNIEQEYPVPPGSDIIAEVKKCYEYCKIALA
jgi:sugar phosphate isomerase/epimerase